MKKLVCLLLLLPAFNLMYSQQKKADDFTFKVGEPYRVFDFDNIYYFSKGKEIMTVKFIRSHTIIQKFEDSKPSLVNAKKYEDFFPNGFRIEQIAEIGEKYYFFYSAWDGKNSKEQLFSIEIDFSKGEFVGQPKLLFAVDGKVSGIKRKYGFFDLGDPSVILTRFDFIQADDKSNLLIQYRRIPVKKNDKNSFDTIGLHLYDQNLDAKFEKEIKMPYTERVMDNLDYQVDNKGNLYMLTKVYHDDSNNDKKNKSDLIANYHIELFRINSGSDKVEISKYDNKDKFINQLTIKDSELGYIVCGGFYSSGKDMKNADGFMSKIFSNFDDSKGIVVFKVDAEGKIFDESSYEIPAALINRYEKPNKKVNDEDITELKMPYLELRELEIGKDGSVLIIGEQYHTKATGANFPPEYIYEDILIAKADVSGNLLLINRIPKKQYANNNTLAPYKYFNIDNTPCFVFLDNVKNLNLPLDKEPFSSGADLIIAKVSNDGTVSKEFILNTTEINGFKLHKFAMNRFLKTSEKSFVFEAYKKDKEDIMIKVDLK